MMTDGVDWAAVVVTAYSLDTRPPLTAELTKQVRERLTRVVGSEGGEVASSRSTNLVKRINEALDAFEKSLDAAVGPRVSSIDTVNGIATMMHRSEGAQPLRAFGGQ